ncbi:MmgE/PrpD family protein [Pseudonocardia yunnanensis]|uniref:MmgE/PrpD family protein n=1 Tax=Pseudonocardia yunnanensis TaxID=58107 RepID=A0ABW4EWV0_9PSEU
MTENVPEVTHGIAEYAVKADVSAAPPDVLDLARRTLVDTVGISIAARAEEAVQILLRTPGTAPGAGTSTVLPTGARTDAPTAALINGTAAHALDYDDVTEQIYGHPSVVLWPAILAAGEQAGAGGRDLLDAYLIGFDVVTALAEGFALREHYGRGWHSTATLGVVAGAAAVSRLLGSDVEQTRSALGLAATMAGGSRQNFGTMTKPLHAGLAARDAVLAASLAAGGFTADPAQLESPLGYFNLYGDRTRLGGVLAALEQPWALRRHGINVKKYPACYNTQRTADATLRLVEREQLDPAEVRRIRVTLEPGGMDPLIHHRPASGLQGKFSGEYVAAAAVLDRSLGLRTFTDESVIRPEARELVERAEVTESATPPVGAPEWEYSFAVVEVDTVGRGTLSERTDVPRGDHRAPLTRDELESKFRDAVDFSGTGWDADALLTRLWSIDTTSPFGGVMSA